MTLLSIPAAPSKITLKFFSQGSVATKMQTAIMKRIESMLHFVFLNLLTLFATDYKQSRERQIQPISPLNEKLVFLHRFLADPNRIGSVFPSSSHLIAAMTKKIREEVTEDTPPRNYLDVGAGTGSFSEGIIQQMRPQDRLVLVEYDPALSEVLRKKFEHHPNVLVHEGSIFDFSPQERYDVVVTGLPLNMFSSADVEKAFAKYAELTREGGHFCYFEYMLLPTISQTFRRIFNPESARNFDEIHSIKQTVQTQYPKEIDQVFLNVTPARAIHLTNTICKK